MTVEQDLADAINQAVNGGSIADIPDGAALLVAASAALGKLKTMGQMNLEMMSLGMAQLAAHSGYVPDWLENRLNDIVQKQRPCSDNG